MPPSIHHEWVDFKAFGLVKGRKTGSGEEPSGSEQAGKPYRGATTLVFPDRSFPST